MTPMIPYSFYEHPDLPQGPIPMHKPRNCWVPRWDLMNAAWRLRFAVEVDMICDLQGRRG